MELGKIRFSSSDKAGVAANYTQHLWFYWGQMFVFFLFKQDKSELLRLRLTKDESWEMQHWMLTCLRGEIFCNVCMHVCMFAVDRNVLGAVIERYDLKRRLKCWKTHKNVMRRSKAIFSHFPLFQSWICETVKLTKLTWGQRPSGWPGGQNGGPESTKTVPFTSGTSFWGCTVWRAATKDCRMPLQKQQLA